MASEQRLMDGFIDCEEEIAHDDTIVKREQLEKQDEARWVDGGQCLMNTEVQIGIKENESSEVNTHCMISSPDSNHSRRRSDMNTFHKTNVQPKLKSDGNLLPEALEWVNKTVPSQSSNINPEHLVSNEQTEEDLSLYNPRLSSPSLRRLLRLTVLVKTSNLMTPGTAFATTNNKFSGNSSDQSSLSGQTYHLTSNGEVNSYPFSSESSPINNHDLTQKMFWLLRVPYLKQFFCVPCLLFMKDVWSLVERDTNDSEIHIMRHENCIEHKISLARYTKFTKLSKKIPSWGMIADNVNRVSNITVIQKLLSDKFIGDTWSDEERGDIIWKGRPCPSPSIFFSNPGLHNDIYVNIPWLTGCCNSKKFYCWPCLLFFPFEHYFEIENSYSTLYQHQLLNTHLVSCVRLQNWENLVRMKSSKGKLLAELWDETFKTNQDFLKHVINVVCCLKKKKDNVNLTHSDYLQSLELLSVYDKSVYDYFMNASTSSIDQSAAYIFSSHIDDVILSIRHCVSARIFKELREATFVSLIFVDVIDADDCWISSIVRFVNEKGDVCERFLKFLNVHDCSINFLISQIKLIVDQLSSDTKLVGVAYSGAIIDLSLMETFHSEVLRVCPLAKIFPYREHDLRILLQNSLSQLSFYRNFFRYLNKLSYFFETNSKAFNNIMSIYEEYNRGHGYNEDWNFSPGYITTVLNKWYNIFIEFFSRMSYCPDKWDANTLAQAVFFLNFLRSTSNRFLIALLAKVNNDIEELTIVLKSNFDLNGWNHSFLNVHQNLLTTKHRGYEEIFKAACCSPQSDRLLYDPANFDKKHSLIYKDVHKQILDFVISFINFRMKNLNSLAYIHLMTRRGNQPFISSAEAEALKTSCPSINIESLVDQLNIVFNSSICQGMDEATLLKYLFHSNLHQIYPDLFKFLQLVLTIPILPNSGSVVVNKIKSYVNGVKKSLKSAEGLLFIENDLVSSMQFEPTFHDDVMLSFNKQRSLL